MGTSTGDENQSVVLALASGQEASRAHLLDGGFTC